MTDKKKERSTNDLTLGMKEGVSLQTTQTIKGQKGHNMNNYVIINSTI